MRDIELVLMYVKEYKVTFSQSGIPNLDTLIPKERLEVFVNNNKNGFSRFITLFEKLTLKIENLKHLHGIDANFYSNNSKSHLKVQEIMACQSIYSIFSEPICGFRSNEDAYIKYIEKMPIFRRGRINPLNLPKYKYLKDFKFIVS
jgi:hypothetical protein